MRNLLLVGAVLVSPAHAQPFDPDYSSNVVSNFKSGNWQAQAADFKGYTYSPQIGCRMSTRGATLTQNRANESRTLDANWTFLSERAGAGDNFRIDWIKVDNVRYQATRLPWRLMKPSDGIVLPFDIVLLSVRRSNDAVWLPATYLTLPLLDAKRLEIGYSFERNDHLQSGSELISLRGFKEVAKWCGRQLLRDRLDQKRVQDLTK